MLCIRREDNDYAIDNWILIMCNKITRKIKIHTTPTMEKYLCELLSVKIILFFLCLFICESVSAQTAESDSLFAIGMYLYNEGRPNDAIPYFQTCDSIDKVELDSASNRKVYSSMWLAACYHKEGKDSIAKTIYENYTLPPIDRFKTIVSDSLFMIGDRAYQEMCYQEALDYYIKAAQIAKNVLGYYSYWYGNSIYTCAECYHMLGAPHEAIHLCTEALHIFEIVLGKEHPDCATTLNDLADYNYEIGNYFEAIRLGAEALQIREKVLGKEHLDYATNLHQLAIYNSCIGNYSEAIRLVTEALQITGKVLGKENPDYAVSLNGLALYTFYIGNYSEAIRLGTDALQIQKRVLGKEHPHYAISLNNLALYNYGLGNYSEAIRFDTEAMQIQEKVLGKEHPDYAGSLSLLAKCNQRIGNYSEAIRLGTEAMQIHEKSLGIEHPTYAVSMSNLATYNSNIGNYSEAIRLDTEALQILGKENSDYATVLHNLAVSNAYLDKYSEAIRLGTEALQITGDMLGKEHPSYAISLSCLAKYNSKIGNYSEAIRLGTDALLIQKKVLGKEHPDYALSLNNLALYNSHIGNYSEAIRLSTEALQIREKVIGKEHPDYVLSLANIADYNRQSHDYTNMSRHTNAFFVQESEMFKKQYYIMTSTEKYFFSKTAHSKHIKDYAYYAPNINQLQQTNYDALLFVKDMAMGALRDIQDVIAESKDSSLVELLNTVRRNNLQLKKQLEKPVTERFLDVDSLSNVIEQQERELATKSSEYGDYLKNMSITHKGVMAKLKKNDIAIEFVEAILPKSDSIVYYALTLHNNYDSPHLIPLFEKKQLKDFTAQEEISQLVWSPLANELKGVKNIYFSPSGDLYKIAVENLPPPDGNGHMSDHFNMYRLSSTRELALDRAKVDSKDAAIYGGMQYSTDVVALEDNAQLYANLTRSDENLYNPYIDSLGVKRDDRKDPYKGLYLNPLPNAKVEATSISKTINDAHIKDFVATVYTDAAATETSFKALSGQKKRVIHVATHGFYYKEEDAEKFKDIMPQLQLDDRFAHRYIEDKQLTRSGLYFAGADNKRLGVEIPEGVDDGILTAQEISMLDLRGCDLVVLSACQTAQGDIGADGVFGLQRAFKKAGVNSILMSIDKIDDRATQLLMTEFYKNYVKGIGKQESLKRAQKFLREETEYKDAKYWSSFILLDALD